MILSVLVITYNSGRFILETLESIRLQSYSQLELIISDDGSHDDTISKCKDWLSQHEGRFVRHRMIESATNTGISANANRAFKASSGTWLKLLAGDDILFPECLSYCMEFVSKNTGQVECFFTQIKPFADNAEISVSELIIPDIKNCFYSDAISANLQYKLWLQVHSFWPVATPGFFIKKELLEKIGGYDERYKFMEDLPLYLKILESGTKIHFLPIPAVRYRVHANSVIREKNQQEILTRFQISKNRFIHDYILPRTKFMGKGRLLFLLLIDRLILFSGNKGAVARFLNSTKNQLDPIRLGWFNRKFKAIFNQKPVH
jgi:glycosyltransferase involved in cell wall biosynthesis